MCKKTCSSLISVRDGKTVVDKMIGLKAIHLVFLPPNTMSKTAYGPRGVLLFEGNVPFPNSPDDNRSSWCKERNCKINILTAMKFPVLLWEDVSESIIRNCFAKALLLTREIRHKMIRMVHSVSYSWSFCMLRWFCSCHWARAICRWNNW